MLAMIAVAVAGAALGSSHSADPPGLRYEAPLAQERGPVERDLRYYPPRPPERPGIMPFGHLFAPLSAQTPDSEQSLDPAAGDSTLRWRIGADVWAVRAKAHVWTDSGYQWVEVEGRRIYELMAAEPAFEIDLASVPGHLYMSIFVVTIDQATLSYGREEDTPGPIVTSVLVSESRLPGDFNRDGTLTLEDLNAYADAFSVQAPRADLNRDGVVDGEDLGIYLAAFEANFRCP